MTVSIAASILSADFANLETECRRILNAGADAVHFDVMDGRYVPAFTAGPPVAVALRRALPNAVLDVHLMINPLQPLLNDFINAKPSSITFHPDAHHNPTEILRLIQSQNIRAGVAVSPGNPTSLWEPLVPLLDLLLIMTVVPGKGGQSLMPQQIPVVAHAKRLLQKHNPRASLHVDGGVNQHTIAPVLLAGADVCIAGAAAFHGNPDTYPLNIQRLKHPENPPHPSRPPRPPQ